MSAPGGRREESVQFSLKELLKLEDERLEESARDRQATEAAAIRHREDSERRLRAEMEGRARAEAEAKERKRLAELDDLARREAMQKAIVEQSRLTVDVRARAEERELERRHEIELAKLRVETKKGQMGPLAGASLLGGFVMLLVVLGVHFAALKPAAERRVAELELNVLASETRVTQAGRQSDEQHRTIEGLEKKLQTVETELANLKGAKPPTTAPHSTKVRTTTAAPPPPPPPPPTVCLKGDPLCP